MNMMYIYIGIYWVYSKIMKLKDSDKSTIKQPCKIDKSMIKYNIGI